jgi:nicotinamide mononucleotide transporter
MVGLNYLVTLLELVAAILGFIYVYFIATERSIGWLFGILSAFFYAIFFYLMSTVGLFSQQVAYIILGFYGLISWSANKKPLPIRSIGFSVWKWILLAVLLGLIFATVIKLAGASKNNSVIVPNSREILDAQFFIFSLLATWLTTRKILENWHIWIVVNIVGVIWFSTEHWWSTALLYFGYLLLAINGLRKWKKQLAE